MIPQIMGHWNAEEMVINYKQKILQQIVEENMMQLYTHNWRNSNKLSKVLSLLPYLRTKSFSGPHLQKFLLSPSFMMPGFGVQFSRNLGKMQTSIATTTSFLYQITVATDIRAIVQRFTHNSLSTLKFFSFAFNARQQGIWSQQFQTIHHLPHSISKCLN